MNFWLNEYLNHCIINLNSTLIDFYEDVKFYLKNANKCNFIYRRLLIDVEYRESYDIIAFSNLSK